MGFGFNSSLGARLQAMGGFPPPANYLPPADTQQPAQHSGAMAPPPGAAPSVMPAQVPAGASSGPGYIPGIYGQMPGMVSAAPASTAVGDAAASGAGADAAAGGSGGAGIAKFLLSLFGA